MHQTYLLDVSCFILKVTFTSCICYVSPPFFLPLNQSAACSRSLIHCQSLFLVCPCQTGVVSNCGGAPTYPTGFRPPPPPLLPHTWIKSTARSQRLVQVWTFGAPDVRCSPVTRRRVSCTGTDLLHTSHTFPSLPMTCLIRNVREKEENVWSENLRILKIAVWFH